MDKVFVCQSSIAEYDENKQTILITFDGYPNIDDHKKMYLEILEFMKSNKTFAFIMDFRKFKGTFTNLNDWVMDTLRPSAEKGLSKVAMVLNEDIFTAFSAQDSIKKAKLVEIQIFKEITPAETWIAN